MGERAGRIQQVEPRQWSVARRTLANHTIAPYQHLMQRADAAQVMKLFDSPEPAAAAAPPGGEAVAADTGIDDFTKVDLRYARILNAERVEVQHKLLPPPRAVGERRSQKRILYTHIAYSHI